MIRAGFQSILNDRSEFLHTWSTIKCSEWHAMAQTIADRSNQFDGDQRVTAHFKKVVSNAEIGLAQHIAPNSQDIVFGIGARIDSLSFDMLTLYIRSRQGSCVQ